jgi:hypothetical protein
MGCIVMHRRHLIASLAALPLALHAPMGRAQAGFTFGSIDGGTYDMA